LDRGRMGMAWPVGLGRRTLGSGAAAAGGLGKRLLESRALRMAQSARTLAVIHPSTSATAEAPERSFAAWN
jgi:hypothetical protein